MRVPGVFRNGHRLWVALPLLAGALGVQAAVLTLLSAESPLFWIGLAVGGWVPPYFLFGIVVLQVAGARLAWRIDLANAEEHRVEIMLYASRLPPFGTYVVFLDGHEQLRKQEGWGVRDRMRFRFGGSPGHSAEVIVSNTNLWPFRRVRVALEVDGRRLADV